MSFIDGVAYNFKGLRFSMKNPTLFLLGLTRLVVILIFTLAAIGLILAKYQEITNLMWTRPESAWLVWIWHAVSWLMTLLLCGISAVLAFLVSQLLFSVVVMDYMSRITERKVTGQEALAPDMPWFPYFFHLIKQEIPRATIPVCISLAFMIFGWLTPLGPVLTVLSPVFAGIFLAWDNTDLVPARRLVTFRSRFRFLRQHLGFHLGFGLCFLVPGLNILLLSFAPVGATLYYVEQIDGASQPLPGSE